MTIPGAGGQQERPFNAPAGQATPVGVQPGTQGAVDFAQVVIVFGPTGRVNGIFVYKPGTTPGPGNGPILSGTFASKDFYGNAVQPGWVSYAAPGSSVWGALANATLLLNAAASVSPGSVAAFGGGNVLIGSGTTGSGDSQGTVELQSKNASGLGARALLQAVDQVQLTAGASALIPVSSAGITTVAQVVAALQSCGIFS